MIDESKNEGIISLALDKSSALLNRAIDNKGKEISINQIGRLKYVGKGIARIEGLHDIKIDEIIDLPGNKIGFAFNLDYEGMDAVLLDTADDLSAGERVKPGNRLVDIPVGDELPGRIIDPLGRPLDNGPAITSSERMAVEQEAPPIMHRAPVEIPLQTGIQVIDSLIPIGRGQRELIIGDRQTGRTAIALDAMINQIDSDVICIYCGIGKRNSAIANVVSKVKEYNIDDKTVIMKASGDDTPGLNYLAPFSAMAIGEYFMKNGKGVLIVLDDLTNHARSYRELSLLLRRPPAREAFPGDIFYLHSRLLERSTHLKDKYGGGSITALPIIETEEQNLSAYIPTNLISITDGQIYLSPKLFQEGVLPAVDIGKSVSRVGGKTQLTAYQDITGDLKLSYSQFEELEAFSRFGTKLNEETRQKLNRGKRVREVFKQEQFNTIPVDEQIMILLALNNGYFDDIELDDVQRGKSLIREAIVELDEKIRKKIIGGEKIDENDKDEILNIVQKALESLVKGN